MRPGLAAALLLCSACGPRQGGPPNPDAGDTLAPEVAALRVVFASKLNDDYELSVRAMGEAAPTGLTSGAGALHPAPSPDGKTVAFTSSRSARLTLGTVRLADGVTTALPTALFAASQPAFSPDGKSIVFEGRKSETEQADIYSIPSSGGAPTQLTTHPDRDAGPVFSPDGANIYFVSVRSGTFEVWRMNADGTSQAPVTSSMGVLGRPAISPDGASLAFARLRAGRADVAELVRYELATQATEVIGTDNDSEPAFSPDGQHLAFTTLRFGNPEVVVSSLTGQGSALVRVTDSPAVDGSAAFVPPAQP